VVLLGSCIVDFISLPAKWSLKWMALTRWARLQARRGENERLKTELQQAQQELRLKDARMSRLAPARRPHYAPVERLEILMLAAARGWSMAATARRFLLTAATIADWKKRCEENGPDALLETREPVNKFPDFVTALVQQCKALVPIAGRRKIAEHLARAGLHLSASTIKRRLEAQPVAPAPTPALPPQSDGHAVPSEPAPRTVVARHAQLARRRCCASSSCGSVGITSCGRTHRSSARRRSRCSRDACQLAVRHASNPESEAGAALCCARGRA
jgi:transposase-like protein